MTDTDAPPQESVADAFRFARQLRDPAFREHLRAIGHTNNTPVAIARAGETVAHFLARIRPDLTDHVGRELLAAADDSQPHGWAFAWIEPVRGES